MRARRTYTLSSGKHSLALVAVLLISLAATAGWAQQDPVARVLKSVGDVKVRHLADAGFDTDVRATMPLVSGDALRVGDGSFVSLLFIDDKTLLKIKPNSEFQIVETRNTRSIMMDYGTLRSLLPQPIKDFRVETPVSVASVKGTDFWLIHDATAGIDRAYGVEGIVEILNVISGLTQNLTVNTMIISTAAGQLSPPIPISPDEMPTDPEELQEGPPEPEGEPEGEPQEGEAAPETGEAVAPAAPAVGEAAAPPEAPSEEEAAEEPEETKRSGTSMGLGLGSVTLDGDVFYQIALRPEFAFGKVGIGLDLVVYMDAEGKFRKDEWDEPSDYLDKLYYLRYATEQDPFFLRIGAMPAVQYGFGALMSGYSNVTEYPQVRRVGFEIGGRIGQNFTLKAFTANLKELGGLVGVRGTYRVAKAFPLTIGVNWVADLNQYGGLKDSDGDDIPDMVDDFPDNADYWLDTDKDGIADVDPEELDLDGDGITDVLLPFDSRYPDYTGTDTLFLDPSVVAAPEPFNKEVDPRSISGISFDLSYPVISRKMFNLVLYTEYGILNYADTLTSTVLEDGTTISANSGNGLIGPGLRAQLFKFLTLTFEYRKTSALYQPGFFNTTYDFERAQFQSYTTSSGQDSMGVKTKDQAIINNPYGMTGFYGGAAANLFNIVTFSAAYQNLVPVTADSNATESNSFIASLSVNTDFIPKLTEARAFYIRTNDDNPLDFKNPSNNTTWGYRIGYQVAPGVSMIYNLQVSYRGDEEIRLLSVETAFSF
ncbi:MAG: FecR domain-containing protein [Candidatus Marinimicrobia bacterium]|nr:FecR domain-containing protein [Candidatus Neomarinimicrobiota bacterium]